MRLSIDSRLQKRADDGRQTCIVYQRHDRRLKLNAQAALVPGEKNQSTMSGARRPRVETSYVRRRQQVKI